MKKISLCITTYNRYEMTLQCFHELHDDERVGEVLIVDDCSEYSIYESLRLACECFPKVRLLRNEKNLDCYKNKLYTISQAEYNWVAILDSDNIFDKQYLDAIYSVQWESNTIYAPTFARPTFDYREFSGEIISKENVVDFLDKKLFDTALNISNYFFNKNEFLSHIDTTVDPNTSEALFTNYNWLKAGNLIYFVPNMEYTHTIHEGSHYRNNCHKDNGFNSFLIEQLKSLR